MVSLLFLAIGFEVGSFYPIINPYILSGNGDYVDLPRGPLGIATTSHSIARYPGGLFIRRAPYGDNYDNITLFVELSDATLSLECKTENKQITVRLYSPYLKTTATEFRLTEKGGVETALAGVNANRSTLLLEGANASFFVAALARMPFPGLVGITYNDEDGRRRLLMVVPAWGIQNVRGEKQTLHPWGGGTRAEVIEPPSNPFKAFKRLCL